MSTSLLGWVNAELLATHGDCARAHYAFSVVSSYLRPFAKSSKKSLSATVQPGLDSLYPSLCAALVEFGPKLLPLSELATIALESAFIVTAVPPVHLPDSKW